MDKNAVDQQAKHSEPAGPLIPPQVAYLLEDKPLLWYEEETDYDTLLASVFAELDPKGAIETVLVKDVVDYIWEARRMRRLKTAAMHAELPGAASRLMTDTYQTIKGASYSETKSHLEYLMRGSASGGHEFEEAALEAMSECNVTPDVLLYDAYKRGLTTITAINDELERLERRRDQILRSLREHRAALAAMAKSLVAREEAEEIDLVNRGDRAA